MFLKKGNNMPHDRTLLQERAVKVQQKLKWLYKITKDRGITFEQEAQLEALLTAIPHDSSLLESSPYARAIWTEVEDVGVGRKLLFLERLVTEGVIAQLSAYDLLDYDSDYLHSEFGALIIAEKSRFADCDGEIKPATYRLFENIEQVLNDESRYCFIKVEDVTGPLLEKIDPKLAPPVATLIKDFTMRNGDVAIAEPEGSECDL
ncbi:hypothetical protein ACGP04_08910 [Piscirickettsia salmonis]|nr:hypothetical protein DA717_14950 [Piscirickettsiaceae bacterium NZ-RLO2]